MTKAHRRIKDRRDFFQQSTLRFSTVLPLWHRGQLPEPRYATRLNGTANTWISSCSLFRTSLPIWLQGSDILFVLFLGSFDQTAKGHSITYM